MKYIIAYWIHNFEDEPTILYSELNDLRFETRKIEIWANGKIGYADSENEINGAGLGLEPVPELSEINKQAEFRVEYITKEQFENEWKKYADHKSAKLTVDHYFQIYKRRKEGYESGLLKYPADLYDQVCILLKSLSTLDKNAECRIKRVGNKTHFLVNDRIIGQISL